MNTVEVNPPHSFEASNLDSNIGLASEEIEGCG